LLVREPAGDHALLRERRAGAVVTSYTRMRSARTGASSAWGDEDVERRADKAEEIEAARGPVLTSARASGVFVHEVLERIPLASFEAAGLDDWRRRPEVSELFDEAIAVHRVDPAQRDHAERLVWSAFTTPVPLPGGKPLARIASAVRIVREMEFVFPVEGSKAFVRGSLDLAFEHEGLTYFVDWKTDSLPSFADSALATHVARHYRDQVTLYALATVKLLGVGSAPEHVKRFGGILYVFLRGLQAGGTGIWSSRPDWPELQDWERALRARWVRSS
jgi:exodeoxyribonuclease V beta subunit